MKLEVAELLHRILLNVQLGYKILLEVKLEVVELLHQIILNVQREYNLIRQKEVLRVELQPAMWKEVHHNQAQHVAQIVVRAPDKQKQDSFKRGLILDYQTSFLFPTYHGAKVSFFEQLL
ncbi:hypothetical protein D3C86_1943920 [compost metagenome]